MIWGAVLLLVLFAVGAFAAYVVGTRRAVKAVGQPTPETAKIETSTMEQARVIVNEGEEKKREVLNADRTGLLSKLRDIVQPRK